MNDETVKLWQNYKLKYAVKTIKTWRKPGKTLNDIAQTGILCINNFETCLMVDFRLR